VRHRRRFPCVGGGQRVVRYSPNYTCAQAATCAVKIPQDSFGPLPRLAEIGLARSRGGSLLTSKRNRSGASLPDKHLGRYRPSSVPENPSSLAWFFFVPAECSAINNQRNPKATIRTIAATGPIRMRAPMWKVFNVPFEMRMAITQTRSKGMTRPTASSAT
jgi:hypothetical protein